MAGLERNMPTPFLHSPRIFVGLAADFPPFWVWGSGFVVDWFGYLADKAAGDSFDSPTPMGFLGFPTSCLCFPIVERE